MATDTELAAILRDAVLRTAPQDEGCALSFPLIHPHPGQLDQLLQPRRLACNERGEFGGCAGRHLPTAVRLRAVAKSDLLDFTSRSAVRQLAGLPTRILPIKHLAWSRSVGLLRRNENYVPPIVKRFVGILKAMAKDAGTAR